MPANELTICLKSCTNKSFIISTNTKLTHCGRNIQVKTRREVVVKFLLVSLCWLTTDLFTSGISPRQKEDQTQLCDSIPPPSWTPHKIWLANQNSQFCYLANEHWTLINQWTLTYLVVLHCSWKKIRSISSVPAVFDQNSSSTVVTLHYSLSKFRLSEPQWLIEGRNNSQPDLWCVCKIVCLLCVCVCQASSKDFYLFIGCVLHWVC